MAIVELIYDGDCPNVAGARAQLLRAFAEARVEPRWREWQADAADSPGHVRGYGSPTILVNGRDVAGTGINAGSSCRLYEQPDGSVQGVPSVAMIAAALASSGQQARPAVSNGGRNWKLNVAMLPGIGAAFLPTVACPACWPAYAGFLSSVGLGFLLDTSYLLLLTAGFLAIAVGALAYRVRRRRGYRPFVLGLVAAAVVLIGKFTFESGPAMYAGLAILIGASLWNSWPRRAPPAACRACVDGQQRTNP